MDIEPQLILTSLQIGLWTIRQSKDEKNSLTTLAGPHEVKLSFFGGLGMGRVGEPTPTEDGLVSVASPLDLLATKLKVVMQRAKAKDYLDVAQLLRDQISLIQGLGAARTMYGPAFAPSECLRALTFFDDGDLATVGSEARELLRREAFAASRMYPIPEIPAVSKQLGGERRSGRPDRHRGDLDR